MVFLASCAGPQKPASVPMLQGIGKPKPEDQWLTKALQSSPLSNDCETSAIGDINFFSLGIELGLRSIGLPVSVGSSSVKSQSEIEASIGCERAARREAEEREAKRKRLSE